MITISIAKDFSIYPAGRLYTDGPYSGERFRKECLTPLLKKKYEKITVILDGTIGYGSSFLDEAFGGVIRDGLSKEEFYSIFSFISIDDMSLIDEIREYVDEAELEPA